MELVTVNGVYEDDNGREQRFSREFVIPRAEIKKKEVKTAVRPWYASGK